jgi:ribosomal protein L16 Arg81 hydroxylase
MEMLKSTPLEVGDLVYLPRGIMHRGIGGVLAQVITVPGFIPGSEIGVDHHLKAINNSLNLKKNEALPYNEEAANAPVIK